MKDPFCKMTGTQSQEGTPITEWALLDVTGKPKERYLAWGHWEREFNPKIAPLSLILLGGGRENRRLAYLRQKLLKALGYAPFRERWIPAIPKDRRQERSALHTQSVAGIFYTENERMRLLVQCQCLVVWVRQEPVLGQIPPDSLTNHFLHRNRLWMPVSPERPDQPAKQPPEDTHSFSPPEASKLKGSAREKVLPSPHAFT